MNIKQKLLSNAVIVIVAMVAMFSLFFSTLSTIRELGQGQNSALTLESDMLKMQRDEREFLSEQDLKYKARFDQSIRHTQATLQELHRISEHYAFDVPELDRMEQMFAEYRKDFQRIVQAQTVIGLDHNSGLTGELRASVHNLENALNGSTGAADYEHLLVDVLQLRRTEKDFMLRADLKYVERFREQIEVLKADLIEHNFPPALLTYAENYETRFLAYVSALQTIGLEKNLGLRQEMRATSQRTEQLVASALDKLSNALADHLHQAQIKAVALFAAMLTLTLGFTFVIGRSIFRPIRRIQSDISQIDASKDLSLRVQYQGRDEIADVASAVNQMLAGFQEVILQVNQAVKQMNQTTTLLSDNVSRTSADIDRQTLETDQVATAVTEMVSTIEGIARNTEFMANNARTTLQAAEQGQGRVQTAINCIHQMSDRLEGSAGSVTELAQQSQTIGSVLNVIQDIADQTNLLALNAAIEAARAGEQGRGFAVVADEVRALAGRTSDATGEISGIISSLQVKTDDIVQLIERSRADGADSRDQASDAESTLTDIARDVTDISDRATQVATAIEQQSSVANEIGQNIIVIRDITEDAAKAVRRNAKASADIAQQAEGLLKVVSAFRV